MNFAKLSATDKLAVYGAVATVIGSLVAASSYPGHWGVTWLGFILGLAMLALVFLPQMSPSTKLPGAHGSLMLVVGVVAAVLMAFVLLTTIDFTFTDFDVSSLLFLIAVAGAIVMGWAGWQAFQAEGGKFNMGTSAEPFVPPPTTPPPMTPPPPSPTMTPPPSETGGTGEDDRP
jgi:hypothetical protein